MSYSSPFSALIIKHTKEERKNRTKQNSEKIIGSYMGHTFKNMINTFAIRNIVLVHVTVFNPCSLSIISYVFLHVCICGLYELLLLQ